MVMNVPFTITLQCSLCKTDKTIHVSLDPAQVIRIGCISCKQFFACYIGTSSRSIFSGLGLWIKVVKD